MAKKSLIRCLIVAFFAFCGFAKPVSAISIENPLKYGTIEELIGAIINFLFYLSLVIGPMIIVIAGYFFVTSMGDPQKVALARKMVLYAAVGLVIIMMAKGIIALIKTVIGVS